MRSIVNVGNVSVVRDDSNPTTSIGEIMHIYFPRPISDESMQRLAIYAFQLAYCDGLAQSEAKEE